MSLTTTQQHFTTFYLAAFLRAPDLGGLNYWTNEVLVQGESLQFVGGIIFSLPVVTAIYPAALSDQDFVEAIYNNVFGRESDAEGLTYWTNEIAALRSDFTAQGSAQDFAAFEARGQLTMNMINAGLGTPAGTDGKAYIVNRLDVADYAVEQQLSTGEEIPVSTLLEIFLNIDESDTSVTEGECSVNSFFDTTAPTQTALITTITDDVGIITGVIANNGVTDDATPLLAGTLSAPLSACETVEVSRNGKVIGNATVNNTTWSYADSGLGNGLHTYTARVVDMAGNQGTSLTSYRVEVDLNTTDPSPRSGLITTPIYGYVEDASQLLIEQADGKLVAAATVLAPNGYYDFALVRYNSDGTLDTGVGGGDGIVTTNFARSYDEDNVLIQQTDGRLVSAGAVYDDFGGVNFGLARYNTDLTLDPSFGGGDGLITTDFMGNTDRARSLIQQDDGKLVVAGLTFQGSSGQGFEDFALARFNSDGSLDQSFGVNGKIITDFAGGEDYAKSVIQQSDGKLVVAGYSQQVGSNFFEYAMARYNADGSLDNSFGDGDGILTADISRGDDIVHSLIQQTDGKLVVAGTSVEGTQDFSLVRFNTDGSLDSSFGVAGKVTTDFYGSSDSGNSMILQADGKLVVAGDAYEGNQRVFALARYNSDGTLDSSFGDGDGKVSTDFPEGTAIGYSLIQQADGKLVIAGAAYDGSYSLRTAAQALARYNADGTLDSSFGREVQFFAIDLAAVSDTGSSSTDNLTNDTTPTFDVTGESGNTVTLFNDVNGNGNVDGGESLGSVMLTGASGAITSSTLTEGTYANIEVIQTNAAGNSSAASAAHPVVTIDTTAPTARLSPFTSTVQLEAIGVTNGDDFHPQVSAIGSDGAFVVTWYGRDSAGDRSIFVQQFNADGSITGHSPMQLEAIGVTNLNDYDPQVSAIGSSGAYVVTWTGVVSTKDERQNYNIFVQQFNADGSTTGHAPVRLEAIGITSGGDKLHQVSSIGSSGAYVVTWFGLDSVGYSSIFVQQFNADGSTTGHALVQLDAAGVTNGIDDSPQVSAIGSSGAYVVTWTGDDSEGDDGSSDTSIFVQQFNADGSTTGHAQVQLEAIGVTNGYDFDPQVSALGSSGAYVVTWYGRDSMGDHSIFVQPFNADGSTTGHAPVQLEAIGVTKNDDSSPQVSSIGSSGAYVVTWTGYDSEGDRSIFVQQFNADGSTTGHAPVQLEAIGVTNLNDYEPQISAIGSSGAYVVTWQGYESAKDSSIFVQQFNADGSTTGHAPVRLKAIGVTDGYDSFQEVSAIGSSGEYVVTWNGRDSAGDFSIFVQPFNADGTLQFDGGVLAKSTEPGRAYLVRDSVAVSDEASILAAADSLWNAVALSSTNTDTYLSDDGLTSGSYHLYTVDLAGNLSAQSVDSYVIFYA